MKSVEANSLWKYRKKLGMGQKRVAHLLDLADNSHYSKWERGVKRPSLSNALKLAYIFKVPVEVLYADLHQSCAEEVDEKTKALSCVEEGDGEEKVGVQQGVTDKLHSISV